ncbi:MAG: hypothetical protein RLY71_4567, partial [Pseudomonadota bacterium]
MRLDSIKLSGFKSFADPTTFQLPGQLVGVVGPNGCGKSNIMDAVRWVLGESKASELRGESMQDVIFNGSGNRKPASRSSVELVFDNADARAGGQWNQFTEIAVKRVLTRDGTSSYYINNQPVRRRDVQDVFLGTGLGPRAYAIIGQGTISRIIESRPEELRLFLEEAAGVSKYKERRRETENRLKDTRENLTRVDDILRELGGNLEKLERQAEVATQYKGLQDAGTRKLHQLWFLKHRDAATEEQRVKAAQAEATHALEARIAELRHVEAELEEVRQAHYAAGDALHAAQGELSQAALEVSRLEERIRYVIEGRQRVEARLAELAVQDAQWRTRSDDATVELEGIAEQIAAADERGQILAAQAEEQELELPRWEDALRAAQQRANEQKGRVQQVQQQIHLLAAESRNLDERSRELRSKRDRLAGERKQLSRPDPEALEALRERHAEAQSIHEEADARLHQLGDDLPQLEDQRRAAQDAVNQGTKLQSELSARLDALKALQDKVQTEGRLKPWLAKHGLDSLSGLWRKLHIEPGWENALEAALRERMQALEVGRIDVVRAFEHDAPPAKLAFYMPGAAAHHHNEGDTHTTLPRLADRLRLTDAGLAALLGDWLEGVYTAPDLGAALAARSQLTHGEIVMTPAGHAVSQFAVSFYAPDSEQAGMLARAQEIEALAPRLREQAGQLDAARTTLVRAEAACTECSLALTSQRRAAAEAQTRAHQLQVDLLRLTQQAEQAQARQGQLEADLGEIDASLEDIQERRAVGEARFEELDMSLGDTQERHA